MNQAQLIDAISKHHANTGVSKASIKWMLEAQAEIVQSALQACEEVTLPGIGSLSLKYREARTGRNPKTGESLEIAAKNVPHFSASKALKDAANSN